MLSRLFLVSKRQLFIGYNLIRKIYEWCNKLRVSMLHKATTMAYKWANKQTLFSQTLSLLCRFNYQLDFQFGCQ